MNYQNFAKSAFIIYVCCCFLSHVCGEEACREKGATLFKSQILEYQQFDGNNIACWLSNDGAIVSNDATGHSGLEWPKGSGKFADYCSGLWIIGRDPGNELRCACTEYRSEFQPGIILPDGTPDDPTKTDYRIYKINSDGTGDWDTWPFHLGAPALKAKHGSDSLDAKGQKIPRLIGDQTIWWVMNDANPERHLELFASEPMGLEVHVLAFGFDNMGPLSNMLFYEWTILNKTGLLYDSTYIGLFDDVDLGDPQDFVGCDPALNMGFVYNPPYDYSYLTRPPAFGFQLLLGPNAGSAQRPQRRGMTSYSYFW